mgnify:CR=1 FL=1
MSGQMNGHPTNPAASISGIRGEDLLVAPVVEEGATSRAVVIPPGTWKGDDGAVVTGPTTIEIVAPLSRLPYFERQS